MTRFILIHKKMTMSGACSDAHGWCVSALGGREGPDPRGPAAANERNNNNNINIHKYTA
jgi:hypothetical protein